MSDKISISEQNEEAIEPVICIFFKLNKLRAMLENGEDLSNKWLIERIKDYENTLSGSVNGLRKAMASDVPLMRLVRRTGNGFSEKELEFVSLVDKAERFKESDVKWKTKYNAIFSEYISSKINTLAKEIGVDIDYYDPDTTYKEDVVAYVQKITEARDDLIDLYA